MAWTTKPAYVLKGWCSSRMFSRVALPALLNLPRPAGRSRPGTDRSAEGGRDQGRTQPGAALGPRTTGQLRTTAASDGRPTAQVSRRLRAFVQVFQSPGLSLARRQSLGAHRGLVVLRRSLKAGLGSVVRSSPLPAVDMGGRWCSPGIMVSFW